LSSFKAKVLKIPFQPGFASEPRWRSGRGIILLLSADDEVTPLPDAMEPMRFHPRLHVLFEKN